MGSCACEDAAELRRPRAELHAEEYRHGYAAHLSDFLDSTHARAFPLEVIPRQGTLYEVFAQKEKAKAKAAGKPN